MTNTLVPESILTPCTLALDHTFLHRLLSLGIGQLAIDLEKEQDPVKLTLWLEQFGIPVELLPEMGAIEFRNLLQRVLTIYRLSGTPDSITMLAEALGALDAHIVNDAFVLTYSAEARHNNLHKYDGGTGYAPFSIDIEVYGIPQSEQLSFDTTFRHLFELFQPATLYLRKILHQPA